MEDHADGRVESARRFFASLVAGGTGPMRDRSEQAFATVPREHFLGPAPWWARTPHADTYVQTPDDDPIHVYQNLLFAIDRTRGINNGEPALHGSMIGALDPDRGDRVLHVGCGTGYYSAILAQLVGPAGSVVAYEIDAAIARRAIDCLLPWENVSVVQASAAVGVLPMADRIYVNAGATHPVTGWLDALRVDGGRLVFPLSGGGSGAWGVTVVVTRRNEDYEVSIAGRSAFIPCIGAIDDVEAEAVTTAFRSGRIFAARSLRRKGPPDDSAVMVGEGWWLSRTPCRPA